MLEFYGAKDYFDCHEAVLVTAGEFLPDALEALTGTGTGTRQNRIVNVDGAEME